MPKAYPILIVAIFSLGVIAGLALHGSWSERAQDFPIIGTYKVLNYNQLEDPAGYIWKFDKDWVHIYVDLNEKPSVKYPYIYDQIGEERYLYILGAEYNVIFNKRGNMQLHHSGGDYPYTCYYLQSLEPLN